MSWRATLASGCSPTPTLPADSPWPPGIALRPSRASYLAPHRAGDSCCPPSLSLGGCSPSPASSAGGMRGGSAAAPAGAPPLERTRQPFFSRHRLQNAPLVPAVGSGEGSKCQGVGLGYRQTAHGPRAPRAQGCPLVPGLPEDKSPFLLPVQAEASPGRTPSPAATGPLPTPGGLHADTLPHRHHTPGEPLHPTARRL